LVIIISSKFFWIHQTGYFHSCLSKKNTNTTTTTSNNINVYQKLHEENDPALRQYLISLGIDPNYVPPENDERRVVIQEFSIIFSDHDQPITLRLENAEDVAGAKDHPFIVKEGCHFKVRVIFKVQHDVLLGFQIHNTISKGGVKIAKDKEMLGTYPPKNDAQTCDVPRNGWNEAPKGILGRGEYKSKMRFMDDDGACHLEFDYILKIAKNWVQRVGDIYK